MGYAHTISLDLPYQEAVGRVKDTFKARQTYLLPDEDRQAALSSFIRFCFSDVAPALR